MNYSMGTERPFDPDDWQCGGTGVTNFQESRRAVYVEAVKRHGDPDLWISEKSFGRGNENYGGALHCNRMKDLSEFWRVFRSVKKAQPDDIGESRK